MSNQTILQVVTPAASYDLTTLEIVKDELQITDASMDVTLTRWISDESERIRAYTERHWAQETVTEQFRLDPKTVSNALLLARWPIIAITSIVEDDLYPLTLGADYEIDPKSGMVRRLWAGGTLAEIPWSWRRQKVIVQYTGGYVLPDAAPLRLQQACLALIKARLANRQRDGSLRSLLIPGVVEKTYFAATVGGSEIPPEVAESLDSLAVRSF